ncbi:DUF6265 family protein [Chryseobacterium sp. sg2396]|uniref:DUF6265 family protein n=1 Tax=Chryseobacterium sp. sg2396 TaxID=3276280 RepID=UPI0025DE8502|nr:DUF6265 family protein [uncultured Chryseobacterium sp.]
MKKINICFAATLLVICACTIKRNNDISRIEWLVGTWEQDTSKGNIYETWRKTGENELTGKSYKLKNNDTIIFETIRLVQDDGRLSYIPAVKDQNSGTPIRFNERTTSNTLLVFENKEHDFPQVISYTKIGKDSLMAEISGKRNDKEEHRYFPMHRIRLEK